MESYANVESPQTSVAWRDLQSSQRLKIVVDFCASRTKYQHIKVTRALPDGQVFVNLAEALSPAVRGSLLLDFESDLKSGVDQGLVVWCEPLGDKSTLRNLRGIEIRTERLTEPHR